MEGGLLLSALLVAAFASAACESCENIFVRWARVKYGQAGRVSGSYSRKDCQEACLNNRHPSPTFRDYSAVECGGFNHRQGQNSLMHDCEIFQPSQLEFLDNSAVADDRYSFYRKLCVPTASRSCQSHYHFSYVPDQYMDPATAVSKTIQGISVEACLGLCLGGAEASLSFSCRSASYNRSSSLCLLSPHSAQSQPRAYRSNQDPNFRIDYYESNCYSNSYAFSHKCTERGFEVSVTSRQPYTGVLYGLYDYFTCRLEPVAKKDFSYLFPFPERSSSCTDSISRRRGGKEYVLEVVLDTDSVEPAYYLTADDLTYQAVCPVPDSAHNASRISASVEFRPASDFHKAHRRLQFGSTTSAGTRLRIKGPTKTIQKSTRPERPTPKWERYWRTSSTTPRPVISTTTSPTTTATTRGAPTTRAAVATERISVETRREASTGANESVLEPILFDIFLGGRRAEAVVVGSGVTLSFTPSLPLPSGHLSLVGCQVEPVGSAEAVLLWEREEPLVLLADSCPADAVGLVCVPERTNFGIRVRTEAFRYQSTSQIQYTCLLRVCAHSPCPQPVCQAVDGCPAQRRRRQSGFLQSSSSLANRFGSPALPSLIRRPFAPSLTHSSGPDQANLARLAGDHVVKKSFVIVNDENELAYFIRTGKVPRKATPAPPVPVPSNPLTNPFFQHLPRQSQQGFWGFG